MVISQSSLESLEAIFERFQDGYIVMDMAYCITCTLITFLLTGTFSCNGSSFKKLCKIFFEIAMSWMTNENNLSVCVNQCTVGDALDSPHLICSTFSIPHMVMLNFLPSLGLNVLLHSVSRLVDTQTKDSYFVAPFVCISNEHLLVVRHWLLAWWTPSGPEIKKHHLALGVSDLYLRLAIGEDLGGILD